MKKYEYKFVGESELKERMDEFNFVNMKQISSKLVKQAGTLEALNMIAREGWKYSFTFKDRLVFEREIES